MDSIHFAWHLHICTRIQAYPVTQLFLLEQPWTPGSQMEDCILTDRNPQRKERQGKCDPRALGSSSSAVLNSFGSDFFVYMGTRPIKGFKAVTKESIYFLLGTCSWARRRTRSEDVSPDALWYSPKLITVFKGVRLPSKELGFSGSTFSEKHYFNGPICQPGITHRLCRQSGVSNNSFYFQAGRQRGFEGPAPAVTEKGRCPSPCFAF